MDGFEADAGGFLQLFLQGIPYFVLIDLVSATIVVIHQMGNYFTVSLVVA
jgi:hypothetical protein